MYLRFVYFPDRDGTNILYFSDSILLENLICSKEGAMVVYWLYIYTSIFLAAWPKVQEEVDGSGVTGTNEDKQN